jgi:predicted transcriptional regulator
MAKVKINADELQHFLDAGNSQADAAKHFGVTEAAISQRVKQLRISTSKVVALERAARVVDQKLDANERLQRVQQIIDEELSWAVQRAKAPGSDRTALQDTILKLAAEVRQQLGLQLSITRSLVDLKVVREFQRSVVEVISEESPEVARHIVARLKERRALRQSANLPSLDGRGGFDVA